jgi:TonB family protein
MKISHCFPLTAAILVLVGTAFAADTTQTKPEALLTPPPELPLTLKGVEAMAMITIFIDEKGKVTDVEISKVSHEGIEDPIKQAVKKWKFKPSEQDGVPVKAKVTIPLRLSV